MTIELMKEIILSSASRDTRSKVLSELLKALGVSNTINGYPVSEECYIEIMKHLEDNKLICAIKAMRADTHLDLKETKQHIDAFWKVMK